MAPPRATLASLQKSVSDSLGKLKGLEEVVAAVRESVEGVQMQAVSDHDNHAGMCQQLQRSVDDLMQRDSGSDGGGVSRSQRADAKDENAAWRTDAICRFWILTAERPAMFNLKPSSVGGGDCRDGPGVKSTQHAHGVLRNRLHGGGGQHVGGRDMFLPEQMDVMVQSLLTIIGTGVEPDTGVERMHTLARAFHEGADTLRVHCRKHRGKLRIAANKNIMRDLVNEDVKSWAADLFGAAVAAPDRLPRRGRTNLDQAQRVHHHWRPPTRPQCRGERVEAERSEARGSSGRCRVSWPMLGVVKAGRLKLRESVRVLAFAR